MICVTMSCLKMQRRTRTVLIVKLAISEFKNAKLIYEGGVLLKSKRTWNCCGNL